jgi:hypothetical protein
MMGVALMVALATAREVIYRWPRPEWTPSRG